MNLTDVPFQMLFMLLFSRQGKLRLQKWYMAYPDKVKKKITRELVTTILARKPKMCSFLEWKDCKIVYKGEIWIFQLQDQNNHPSVIYLRYASLYFCCAIEQNDNELLTLEIIHRYVELLDKYFGSVSSYQVRCHILVLIFPSLLVGLRTRHNFQL